VAAYETRTLNSKFALLWCVFTTAGECGDSHKLLCCSFTGIDVRRPKSRSQKLPATTDAKWQIAIPVIVTVNENFPPDGSGLSHRWHPD